MSTYQHNAITWKRADYGRATLLRSPRLAPEVDKQSSCASLACGRSMAAGKSSAGASPSRQPKRTCRVGISLLEVVLALAILGVASAYLAQSMQLAAQNAIRAQRLTQAELVMESVMNQVIAGVIPAQSITWAPYTTTSANGNWNYMINVVQAEMQGMIGIQVAVQESRATDATDSMMPDLMATRWIIDPSLQLDVPPEQTTDSGTGTSGTGQSSSGQGGGSAAGAGGVQ